MIYDCFTFYNELDILELRLNILNEVVDRFVLVEATRTFNNQLKPLYYENNKERYKEFSDKIIHIVVDDYPEFVTAWHFENFQRNAILRGLSNCIEEDVIIISDVDEIPKPEVIKSLKVKDEIVCLVTRLYWYYLNNLKISDPIWRFQSIKVLNYGRFTQDLDERFVVYNEHLIRELNRDTTPNKVRLYRNCRYLYNAGWHFSYIGDAEYVSNKIRNFSHQEFNSEQFTKEAAIQDKIEKGLDLFTGKKAFAAVKMDSSFPMYIQRNQQRLNRFIAAPDRTYSANRIKTILLRKTLEARIKAEVGKLKYLFKKVNQVDIYTHIGDEELK